MFTARLTPLGTGEEQSYDPQRNLELFYYGLPIERRIEMPYDLRDHFETTNPDLNDQFVFFMLAFFDKELKKNETELIDLGFSALLCVLDRKPAIWIGEYSIKRIEQELRNILRTKSIQERADIFTRHIPDPIKRVRLHASLHIMGIVDSGSRVRYTGFGF